MIRQIAPLLLCLAMLGGCAPGVSGVVRDGGTERPVGKASLALHWVGWGRQDGQLVWDAPKQEQTISAADGSFGFDRRDGNKLTINAPGFDEVETGLCPSAVPAYVGGPFQNVQINQVLLFALPGTPKTAEAAIDLGGREFGDALGLKMSGPIMAGGNDYKLAAVNGRQIALTRGRATSQSRRRIAGKAAWR